jgi:hypothetical protein
MTYKEKQRVFVPSKVIPLFDPVFRMQSSRQTALFEMIEGMIGAVSGMSDVELDVARAHLIMFNNSLSALRARDIGTSPVAVMYDWTVGMGRAVEHLLTYGSYRGFTTHTIRTTFVTRSESADAYMPHGMDMSRVPSPALVNERQYVLERSPSPVVPYYYH